MHLQFEVAMSKSLEDTIIRNMMDAQMDDRPTLVPNLYNIFHFI